MMSIKPHRSLYAGFEKKDPLVELLEHVEETAFRERVVLCRKKAAARWQAWADALREVMP